MTELLLLFLLAQAPSESKNPAGATPGAHELGEEVIKGEVEVKITDTKPYFAPQIDPFSPIHALLAPEAYIFDEVVYKTIDSMTVPQHFIHSSYLRVPVERNFIYGDVLVFLPSFENRVASWELIVSNSLGATVRRVKQKGQPPALMTWDGKTDDGDPIATGETYSFTFNAYDAQGNQTRIPCAPQRVNAMVQQIADEWVISIAADQIFAENSSTLLDQAEPRLAEAANIIKEKFKKEVVIYVYTQDEKLTTDRLRVLKEEMARRTVLPLEALKAAPRFVPGLQPKLTKTEIHVI